MTHSVTKFANTAKFLILALLLSTTFNFGSAFSFKTGRFLFFLCHGSYSLLRLKKIIVLGKSKFSKQDRAI